MNASQKLTAWLRSELCRPQKPVAKIVLRSAPVGGKGIEIETFELEASEIQLEEIPVYAESVIARAQEDADSSGSRITRYTLQSFRKGDEKPAARYSFRLRGESDPDLDEESGGEEPANPRGLLSQLMRHNEAIMRTFVTSTNALSATMARRLESADRLNERLTHELTEQRRIVEEARGEQHVRDMEMMSEDASIKRKDAAFGKMMALVPLVINKLAGGKVLPDKSDPMMMLLEPFISSMTPDQFQAIQGTLSPEQTIMFVELLQAFQKRKQLANGEKDKPS